MRLERTFHCGVSQAGTGSDAPPPSPSLSIMDPFSCSVYTGVSFLYSPLILGNDVSNMSADDLIIRGRGSQTQLHVVLEGERETHIRTHRLETIDIVGRYCAPFHFRGVGKQ